MADKHPDNPDGASDQAEDSHATIVGQCVALSHICVALSHIEESIERVPVGSRAELLRELLASELEESKKFGVTVEYEEFESRFSEYSYVVVQVFNEAHERKLLKLPTLGQCRLLCKIGQGGMGAVYKAFHPYLDKLVAVKVLPEERTHSPQAVARFRREMRAAGKIDHPNIVRATNAGESNGQHYLEMEYVDGMDVKKLCQAYGERVVARPQQTESTVDIAPRTENHYPSPSFEPELARLGIADACEIVRRTAAGLGAIHNAGMVHRDIKPSNIMLTTEGQVKILDLGLAQLRDPHAASDGLSMSQQVMGTVDYMAPEQCKDSTKVDIRADIYSLGCTLYELLVGHAPYAGKNYDTLGKKIAAHLQDEMTPIESRRPDVSGDFSSVLARMVAKDPAARYASPDQVSRAVEPFCAGADLAMLYRKRDGASPATKRIDQSMRSTDDQWRASIAHSTLGNTLSRSPSIAAKRSKIRTGIRVAVAALCAAVAAAVIVVVTDRGTLEITTADEHVRVNVRHDGEIVDVYDTKTHKRLRLRSGSYELDLANGDKRLTLSTKNFTLSRGGKKVVEVSFKPNKPPPSQTP